MLAGGPHNRSLGSRRPPVRRGLRALPVALAAALAVLSGGAACARVGDAGEASWTLCLYLCGSDLESRHAEGTRTLNALLKADVPSDVRVLVQTGGARAWRIEGIDAGAIQRSEVRDGELELLESLDAASMGSGDTLGGFLAFCADEAPSERAAVVLWNHGGGPLGGVCFDENEGYDSLGIDELEAALAAGAEARGGVPYDIAGMDACLMGSAEVAGALAGEARYLVASEELEPGEGWDYEALVDALAEGPALDTEDVAASICDAFWDRCERFGTEASATLSAIDLSAMDVVGEALDAAIDVYADADEPKRALSALADGARAAEAFGADEEEGSAPMNLVDLIGFARANAGDAGAAGEAFSALAEAADNAVVHRVAGPATADAFGLSFYYPVSFDADELGAYAALTPFEGYVSGLSRMYAGGSAYVELSDAGSIEDGVFYARVDQASRYDLYDLSLVVRRADGTAFMSEDIDIIDDWDGLRFGAELPRACVTLGGMPLDSYVEPGYNGDYIVYTAPVTVNGESANIRFAWIWDGEVVEDDLGPKETGPFQILGIWDGIDRVTGLSDRYLGSFEKGDVVCALSSETLEPRGDEIVVGADAPGLDEVPLEEGAYECWFEFTDVYGGVTTSAKATYTIG